MIKEYLRLKEQYPELDIDLACGIASIAYRYMGHNFFICLCSDSHKEQLENYIKRFLKAKEAFEKTKKSVKK